MKYIFGRKMNGIIHGGDYNPEVMRVDSMGNRNRHGMRHNHCLSSPVFQEKARTIDRKLAEAVGNISAIPL